MNRDKKTSIRIAGNTQNPVLITLREKGYRFWVEPVQPGEDIEFIDWNAEKNGNCFSATGPAELLGLVVMHEHRGDDWPQKEHESDICDELLSKAELEEQVMELRAQGHGFLACVAFVQMEASLTLAEARDLVISMSLFKQDSQFQNLHKMLLSEYADDR